ncbi:hypothetical protein H5410_045697, partial [Solanum commersonii]
MLAILVSCASSSTTKVSKCPHRQRSHLKRGTQCIFSPIGLPLFFNRLSIRLTQDKKGLSKDCNEADCK